VQDGDVTLADSNAILIYLGERYDGDARFYPKSPEGKAAVQRWLSVAAGQIAYGPSTARRVKLLGTKENYEQAVAVTERLFATLEIELSSRSFLVGEQVSVADLALYAYVARAPEGGISLEKYPQLRAWLGRIEALPGFVPMLVSAKG
jgi:glutathione S-transferase